MACRSNFRFQDPIVCILANQLSCTVKNENRKKEHIIRIN